MNLKPFPKLNLAQKTILRLNMFTGTTIVNVHIRSRTQMKTMANRDFRTGFLIACCEVDGRRGQASASLAATD